MSGNTTPYGRRDPLTLKENIFLTATLVFILFEVYNLSVATMNILIFVTEISGQYVFGSVD